MLLGLQVPLPHESSFNATDNPYTSSEFLKICEDYGVPNNPMKYRDEKIYWTCQHGVGWPNDYIGLDSMTWWIIEKSDGFTDVGLCRISESIRAYAYLIPSYQDTLSYASSKVDYSVGENIYMLPSDMNLKIRSGTVGYNNKILVSDGKFSLGKNEKVNSLVLGPRTLLAKPRSAVGGMQRTCYLHAENEKPYILKN